MIIRIVAVLVLLGGVLAGMYKFNFEMKPVFIAGFLKSLKPPPAPVTVDAARSADVPQRLNAIGTIVAVRQVQVSPEVAGRVVQIFAQPGTRVKAGDALVQLNDKPERADLANFQAQARVADLTLKRSSELATRQFTPQATVDQQQALLDQAKAGIAKTEALIAQKLIRAPFDGELGIRQVDLGQYVQTGTLLFTLTDLDQLYVNFSLPEQERGRVDLGQAVEITVDAYPGQKFLAKITTIDPQVTADTRSVKVQATLDNVGHKLQPGMFANAHVVLPPDRNVVVVPETAVEYSLYGDAIYIVVDGKNGDGAPIKQAKRQYVKTGARFDNQVAVLSGVNPGDQIIVSGQIKLQPDAEVTIARTPPLVPPANPPLN